MSKYKFGQFAINCTQKKTPEPSDYATYIGLEHMDSKNIHITRWGSDVPIIGDKLVMHKGDILLGKRNAYLRRAAIAPHDGLFSAHGMILRPNEKLVDYDFFVLFIASDYFFDEAIRISVGSLSPTINWKDLKELEFDLPDLETQRSIARTLWSINNTLDKYKELSSLSDDLIKAEYAKRFSSDDIKIVKLEDCLEYEQPTKYIVDSDQYNDSYKTPVLTAGKSFILGYTNEETNIYCGSKSPTIIFDDFTTESKYVDFDFKVKSSAMKLLHLKNRKESMLYYFYAMQSLGFEPTNHQRHWISIYSQLEIKKPSIEEQNKFEQFVLKTEETKLKLKTNILNLEKLYTKILTDTLGERSK